MVAVDQRRHREHAPLVAQDGFDDPCEPDADRIVGGTLPLDDRVRGIPGALEDRLHVLAVADNAVRRTVVVERHARDAGCGPCRQLAVAVFPEHVGVNVARIHVEVLPEQRTEARGVQDRARADDALVWQSGQAPRLVRHHVHWIARHQQKSRRIVPDHLTDHVADDARIPLQQCEPALARPLRRSRGDHGHGGAGAVPVVARPDPRRVRQRNGVCEVHRLALRPRVVRVEEHDLRGEPAQQERVGERRTNVTRTDDGDPHRMERW